MAYEPQVSLDKKNVIWGNEERVLLKDAADNYDRVRPQGVHHHARAKFRQIIRADHNIVVLRSKVVAPRLELDQVFDAWQVDERPFHVPQESCLGVPCRRTRLEHLFERRQPDVLVKPASAERSVLPRTHLQLAAVHRLLHIDTCFGEPPAMFFALLFIDAATGVISPLSLIFVHRAKHPVFLVSTVEESANVTLSGKIASGKLHGMTFRRHISPHSRHAPESAIAKRFHMSSAPHTLNCS